MGSLVQAMLPTTAPCSPKLKYHEINDTFPDRGPQSSSPAVSPGTGQTSTAYFGAPEGLGVGLNGFQPENTSSQLTCNLQASALRYQDGHGGHRKHALRGSLGKLNFAHLLSALRAG